MAARNVRRVLKKVDHGGKLFTYVPAQMAASGPPLGSQLGQIGVNIAQFVKDFNLKTSVMKEGVPIPCNITINADRSYNLEMNHPPWSYFLKQAAGIQRGAMNAWKGEISGLVSRRHIYEIAKIKAEDPEFQMVDMKVLVERCIDESYSIGLKVVDDIDPVKYEVFLKERAILIEQQKADLQATKEAKLLRTAVAEAKAEKNA